MVVQNDDLPTVESKNHIKIKSKLRFLFTDFLWMIDGIFISWTL